MTAASEPAAGAKKTGAAKWLGLLFGIAVSAGAAWLFFRSVSLADLGRAVGGLNPAWVILGFAMLLGDYLLRCWRWTLMLRGENPALRVAQVAPFFMASIALNNVLPFRAGDVTRALVFPARIGVGRGFAAATLVVERLLDLTFVLMLMAAGLFLARDRLNGDNFIRDTAEAGAALALLGVVGVLAAIGLAPLLEALCGRIAAARDGLPAKVADALAGLFASVSRLRSARLWALLLPSSALIWALEAGMFWAVIRGFGGPNAVADAALLGSAGTLATLIPSTPGYIGTFHLAVQQAAALLGTPRDVGSLIAILAHAILWAGTTLVGLIFLLGLSAKPNLRSSEPPNLLNE